MSRSAQIFGGSSNEDSKISDIDDIFSNVLIF